MPFQAIVRFVAALAFVQLAAAESGAAESISVGLKKQLLVDDHVISSTTNISRKLGQVTKARGGRPLSFTRTLPDGRSEAIDAWPLFATVRFDPDRNKFRMWHRISFDDTSRQENVKHQSADAIGVGANYHRGYSESDDGLHFDFVALLEGLTTSGDTNLVVTVDEHETDPAHRYKIGYDAAGPVHAAALAHSADGIHWTPYNDEQPGTDRAADQTDEGPGDAGNKV